MKNKKGDDWFPMWSDKWIFGSTRIELDPAERGVWVDLMALGNKDDGYIRANESTPYLHTQLSGLLNIPPELLESTLTKCLKYGKLAEDPPGIYYIISRQTYELSKRHKRRLDLDKNKIENKSKRASAKADTMSSKGDIPPVLNVKPKKEYPNPAHTEDQYDCNDLVGYFCKKFEAKTGMPYATAWAKEATIMKGLLNTYKTTKTVLDLIDVFFWDEEFNQWAADKRTIGIFKVKVNELAIKYREELNKQRKDKK